MAVSGAKIIHIAITIIGLPTTAETKADMSVSTAKSAFTGKIPANPYPRLTEQKSIGKKFPPFHPLWRQILIITIFTAHVIKINQHSASTVFLCLNSPLNALL